MLSTNEIICLAAEKGASDVHIVCGLPVRIRVAGELVDMTEQPLTETQCEQYARELTGEAFSEIESIGELDMAKTFDGSIRTRLNVFRQQRRLSAAIRILSDRIRTPQELNLPPVMQELSKYHSGLVLVTGETGSGKSTTLAALIDEINHNRREHIITLEDPIEYVYKPDKCVINQREVGTDTRSYSDGLRSVLREDPDVILIGEMCDINTIEVALTAAETGHLVFSTLHTNSAAESIDRIVGVFPDVQQHQIRLMLSNSLRAIVSQQLLPRKGTGERIAACEVMIVNTAIRNLIRENKTAQIDSFISLGAQNGSISVDNALAALLRSGEISRETAMSYARVPEHIMKL